MLRSTVESDNWETVTTSERPRLVHLCAHLIGDVDAAEDLAQETLYEAVRNAHKLRNPDALTPWLSGIARNLCRNWVRQRGRELAHLAVGQWQQDDPSHHVENEPTDDFDLEIELERKELAQLLDQAMTVLPSDIRQILIQRLVEVSPYSEIAARLGVREGTIRTKLHRGKLLLRKVLTTDLIREAVAYGLVQGDTGPWQETRIWCPFCGQQRLCTRRYGTSGAAFCCSTCSAEPGTHVVYIRRLGLLEGVKIHKAIATRQLIALHEIHGALLGGCGCCLTCERPVPFERLAPGDDGAEEPRSGIYIRCPHCPSSPAHFPSISRGALALTLPETRRFWRAHPRMRRLPDREFAFEGRSAVLTRYESLSGSAGLDVVTDLKTYAPIAILGPSRI